MGDLKANAEQGPTVQDRFRQFVSSHEIPLLHIVSGDTGVMPVTSFSTRKVDDPDVITHVLELTTSFGVEEGEAAEELLSVHLTEDDNNFSRAYDGHDLKVLKNHSSVAVLLKKLEILEKSGMVQPVNPGSDQQSS